MIGDRKERWQELCALAAAEQDPKKLSLLVAEINALLEEKEQRLLDLRKLSPSPTNTRTRQDLPHSQRE